MSNRPSDSAAHPVCGAHGERVVGGRRQEDLSGMGDGDESGGTCQRRTDRFVVAHLEIADVDSDSRAVVHDRARCSHGTDRIVEDDVARGSLRAQLGPALRRGDRLEVIVPAAVRRVALPRIAPTGIVEIGDQHRPALDRRSDADQTGPDPGRGFAAPDPAARVRDRCRGSRRAAHACGRTHARPPPAVRSDTGRACGALASSHGTGTRP